MKMQSWALRNIEESRFDRGAAWGLGIGFMIVFIGIFANGKALSFLDPVSIGLVLGGTIAATLVHYSFADLHFAFEVAKKNLVERHFEPVERIDHLVRLAQRVRQDGLLTLEREAQSSRDPFLRMAFELTADGQQAFDIKKILETDIYTARERALRAAQLFQTMGSYAPAFGLIGTLIGLIQMLGALDNPSTVGPAMALALVATLYGAIFANLVFLPLAGKIRLRTEEDALVKTISLEGILCLGKQESPLLVEQKLRGFLPLAKAA